MMGFPKGCFDDCSKFEPITNERIAELVQRLDYMALDGDVTDADFVGLLSRIHRLEKEVVRLREITKVPVEGANG